MDPFVGEIRLFGFRFAPLGWVACEGQTLPIAQYTSLFWGNGGFGQGNGLSPYAHGQLGGSEQVTLEAAQLPAHNHAVAASSAASGKNPSNAMPAVTPSGASYGTSADMSMSPTMVSGGGNGQPHDNRPPYIALNWCIALQGVYPSRN